MSRDEQSVLIVSYAELKNCLENAFSELMSAANWAPQSPNYNSNDNNNNSNNKINKHAQLI